MKMKIMNIIANKKKEGFKGGYICTEQVRNNEK